MEQRNNLQEPTARTYVCVWVGLLMLTGLTVSMAGRGLGKLSVLVVLVIAGVKSGLILLYFMHLKYERGLLFKLIMPGTILLLVLFIGMVFTDIAFR
jgi:cytochrome c oxidase subunit IV